MTRVIQFALFSTAVVLVVAGNGSAQSPVGRDGAKTDEKKTEPKTDGKAAPPTIVGTWRAASISLALPDGSRKTLAGKDQDQPVSVILSEKTCTMWIGGKVAASMDYVLDAKQEPWTIDMKSKEGELLGICRKQADKLAISLDDRAKGRPADFDEQKHGMVLDLWRFPRTSLLVMNADGSNLHKILTMPEFTFIGSPKWSHGGDRIAFDGWRAVMGERSSNAHVFTVKADGSDVKDLGAGAMPSWSPDDKQFACMQFGPEPGVGIMNADGSDRRQIDAGGQGGLWSPRRNEIAYTVNNERGAVLSIYDVDKKQARAVDHKPYQQLFWHFSWSPDGDWICFKGILPGGGAEVVALSEEGEKKGFKVLLPGTALPEVKNCYNLLSWGGTGEQILIRMRRKSDRAEKLYILDSSGVKPPQAFPNSPAGWQCNDMAWSWDGKKVAFSARVAKPVAAKPNVNSGSADLKASSGTGTKPQPKKVDEERIRSPYEAGMTAVPALEPKAK